MEIDRECSLWTESAWHGEGSGSGRRRSVGLAGMGADWLSGLVSA